ncbi:MAG TPA: hypothetical protein VFO16_01515 [Pseudonocardiaceae bacterium]|nr:hypothetical protein [Pseudonocardiaceae bacterium]
MGVRPGTTEQIAVLRDLVKWIDERAGHDSWLAVGLLHTAMATILGVTTEHYTDAELTGVLDTIDRDFRALLFKTRKTAQEME